MLNDVVKRLTTVNPGSQLLQLPTVSDTVSPVKTEILQKPAKKTFYSSPHTLVLVSHSIVHKSLAYECVLSVRTTLGLLLFVIVHVL